MSPASLRPTGSLVSLAATVLLSAPGPLAAQRTLRTIGLRPPVVGVTATPLAATVAWRPVTGAIAYTVEWATTPAGPWTTVPVDPRAGNQVTMPSTGGLTFTGTGGTLYYYRVTAVAELGEPGVSVVPRVTPQLDPPTGVVVTQEGTDAVVTWVPVPYATGYQISVAPGQQLPPFQSVETDPRQTEARLLDLVQTGGPIDLWVTVRARYGGATSSPVVAQVSLLNPQSCWPASSVPGPAPTVFAAAIGPTVVTLSTTGSQQGTAVVRAERAISGSQAWQGAGCSGGEIVNQTLAPGTQYQFRVTEMKASGSAGQTVATVATPPAPDSPPMTATIGACAAAGCPVTFSWTQIPGAIDYRIESSYGLYRGSIWGPGGGAPAGTPVTASIGTVPSGVHTFAVTPLFRAQRPSTRPPSLVTVTVP